MKITELVVESDQRTGGGGFLEIRRLHLRNKRADGSVSAPYICDAIARPYGQDAVVVAIYARDRSQGFRPPTGEAGRAPPSQGFRPATGEAGRASPDPAGVRVLLREGLRPALGFGRDPAAAPLAESPPALFLTELVAGIVEAGDRGEAGLRVRAAHEVEEEAGFVVDPAAITLLGAGMYPSPGSMVEKFYFTAVEVDPAAQRPLAGDGSPMEEGATTRWLPLAAAIAACVAGEIVDLKTEAALRRLSDHLSSH